MLLVTLSPAANEQAQQPNSPKMQLSQSEEYLSERKQTIENHYSDRLTELRLRAQADIRLLEVAEQPKPDWIGLDQWSEFAEAVLQMNGIKNESDRLTASPAQRLAAALIAIAKRKNDIVSDLEWQTVKLNRQKNYALTDGLAKIEKRQKEISLEMRPDSTHGVVTGIIYSDDGPVAIIDGTVVRENEKIYGARIVKIHSNRIEFDRNDRTWTQHVREIQQANWK